MSVVERAIDKLRRASSTDSPKPKTTDSESQLNIGTLEVRVLQEVPEAAGDTGVLSERRILIDRQAVRAAGYLPETSQDRQFSDHYRHIKRPLIAATVAQGAVVGPGNPRLIMMGSALPGDGKTFSSINLALSLSRERDISVVLVDADVAKPHISRIFGVDKEPGLLDALSDESIDVESLILGTDVQGLFILPAGKPHEAATEYLASARMGHLVTRIISRDTRRIALFDSSPLLVSSESRALATVMGQVVLVVRAGHTPRQAVLNAITHLGQGKSIGLVLNQGRPSITQGYYGQGAYGSYGDDTAVEEK